MCVTTSRPAPGSCKYCKQMASLCAKAPAKRSQHIATCVRLATMLRCVATCWLKFDQFQTWANSTQHVTTHRNTVAKRTQHVAPNNVAICCVGMLRSFGRGLTLKKQKRTFHCKWSSFPTKTKKATKFCLAVFLIAVLLFFFSPELATTMCLNKCQLRYKLT